MVVLELKGKILENKINPNPPEKKMVFSSKFKDIFFCKVPHAHLKRKHILEFFFPSSGFLLLFGGTLDLFWGPKASGSLQGADISTYFNSVN